MDRWSTPWRRRIATPNNRVTPSPPLQIRISSGHCCGCQISWSPATSKPRSRHRSQSRASLPRRVTLPDEQLELWKKVDGFFTDALIPADSALDAALAANRESDLPAIDVTP